MKPYRSCRYLETGITCAPNEIVFCCDRQSPGSIQPTSNAEDTVDKFLQERERIIQENQGDNPPCDGCPLFTVMPPHSQQDMQIRYISMSTDSYCQFSCIYCILQRSCAEDKNKPEHYDCIAISNELKRRGLLSDQLVVSCAPGEISIHPRKAEYYSFIEENADIVHFFSNAGKFDERMSQILASDKRNLLFVSIDAGTAETFKLVRGVDMFDRVIENLLQYRRNGATIILKYILLKENCNPKDIEGFIAVCKNLNVSQILISEDFMTDWDKTGDIPKPEEFIINSALRLVQEALHNHIPFAFVEGFGRSNLKEIYFRLSQQKELLEAEEKLNKLFLARTLICYGAGGNFESVISEIRELELRTPDILWDRRADERGKEAGAFLCTTPDFESLSADSDIGIFITITNPTVNQELVQSMYMRGFKNVISNDVLNLALMAKQGRKYSEHETQNEKI